jgi:hypothetical protein
MKKWICKVFGHRYKTLSYNGFGMDAHKKCMLCGHEIVLRKLDELISMGVSVMTASNKELYKEKHYIKDNENETICTHTV